MSGARTTLCCNLCRPSFTGLKRADCAILLPFYLLILHMMAKRQGKGRERFTYSKIIIDSFCFLRLYPAGCRSKEDEVSASFLLRKVKEAHPRQTPSKLLGAESVSLNVICIVLLELSTPHPVQGHCACLQPNEVAFKVRVGPLRGNLALIIHASSLLLLLLHLAEAGRSHPFTFPL